ncbi:MAG TPA: cupredoxin domain-containing protein [Burkholderiales bacterium]|nr:cupredoxin domain-containing protein [Burkholderiales bacterium]
MKPIQRYVLRVRALLLMAAIAAGALYAAITCTHEPQSAAEKVIPLTVKRFQYSLREIKLKKGVPVVFEIASLDVPHGFNLPDFQVRADVIPGKVTRVRVVPDRAGAFAFRCDIFCGGGHEDLDGIITVTE